MRTARGAGPDVVLLHGVGLSPGTFDPLLAMIPHRCSRPTRRSYRDVSSGTAAPDTVTGEAIELLHEQLDADDHGRPAVVVGVSGGATLALAMASVGHPRLLGVVAHEPLVGPAAPALHRAVTDAARTLAMGPGSIQDRATAFVRGLVGEYTWARLPDDVRTYPAVHAVAVHAEVPRFVRFELPDRFAVPVTVSTGDRSHERRHQAAQVLAAAGARSVVVPGSGHLAVWDQPAAIAELVDTELTRWAA